MIRTHKRRYRLPKWSAVLRFSAIIVGLFLFLNAGIWVIYRTRTYPNARVANAEIGSVQYAEIGTAVTKLDVLPASIRFVHDDASLTLTLAELGVRQDTRRTAESAQSQRSWLPIANLLWPARLSSPVTIDDATFRQATDRISATFQAAAADASLVLDGSVVEVRPATPGYRLDTSKLKGAILAALDAGSHRVSVPTLLVTPAILSGDLGDDRQALDGQLATTVILRYGGKEVRPTRDEIAQWFMPSAGTYAVSVDKVLSYITQAGTKLGIRVQGSSQVAATVTEAVKASRSTDITLTAVTVRKKYTYCVAVKNVATEHLAILRPKLQSTLDDSRGWSLDGLVSFTYADSSCDFTVWLASADQMPSFGAICDSLWSCRVGNNVVLNFDRWQGASTAWNASGGSLDDYRSMLINHEVGHRLGFGHKHCSAAGQPAPVMQQQSINLEGCTFNPWPLSSELTAWRTALGI